MLLVLRNPPVNDLGMWSDELIEPWIEVEDIAGFRAWHYHATLILVQVFLVASSAEGG